MKHCTKCGKELFDQALICTNCGCEVGGSENTTIDLQHDDVKLEMKKEPNWLPLVFGIIALLNAFLLMFRLLAIYSVGYLYNIGIQLGFNSCGIFAVITSIKYMRSNRPVFSILGLVFGAIHLLVCIIYFATLL